MSEYNTEKELEEIRNWPIQDAHNLFNRLRDMWTYDTYFREKWSVNDRGRPVLLLELHTGGWSGNEEIVSELKQNLFWGLWWYKHERGGHYYFEVNYHQIGFKPISEYCKEHNVSRQYVYKIKDRFEWVIISKNKRLIREVKK